MLSLSLLVFVFAKHENIDRSLAVVVAAAAVEN